MDRVLPSPNDFLATGGSLRDSFPKWSATGSDDGVIPRDKAIMLVSTAPSLDELVWFVPSIRSRIRRITCHPWAESKLSQVSLYLDMYPGFLDRLMLAAPPSAQGHLPVIQSVEVPSPRTGKGIRPSNSH